MDHLVSPKLTPAAFSLEIEAADEEVSMRQLRAICKLGRMTAVSVLTMAASSMSGPLNPSQL